MKKQVRKQEETFAARPFEKLKKMLSRREAALRAAPASCNPVPARPSVEEDEFGSAMREVTEIAAFRSLSCPPSRPAREPRRKDPDQEALAILEALASGAMPLDLASTQEYIEWTSADLRPDLVQRLHEGRFSVQGIIDLHGCTEAELGDVLGGFLSESLRKGRRCIKIIHGRGLRSPRGPVLKKAVVKLLAGRHRKQVLAFVTARQCDGGLGALYVLLGRSR